MDLAAALAAHGVDAHEGTDTDAVDGQVPSLVARPGDTEQVSAAMKAAADTGATVAVAGNGTKQTWGRPAPAPDLLVDLSTMNALVEHQPGDLIVVTQPGLALTDLQSKLAPAGQRLGLDEMVPGTTVGGLIATNPSGPRRLHTGTVRDLLIGVTVVRADGTVARAGGKVVKNVAGYDLCKLMTGAFGTLGVITQATFRLHPCPQAQATVSAVVPRSRLAETLAALVRSQDAPSAIEIDCADEESATVAALIEGTTQGVDQRRRNLAGLLGSTTSDDDAEWMMQYPFAIGGSQLGCKITCRLSLVADMAALATRFGLHVRGSAGTGVLYAAATRDDDVADVRAALDALRPAAARAGGAVTVVDGPREAREQLDVWGPVPGLAVMQRIKDEFDPDHRLQPGRFVGGI